MNMKKILKIVLIIILIIFVLFMIHTIRNYMIISKMQDNIASYISSTNYHTKTITKEADNVTVIFDYYKKDEKEVVFLETQTDDEIRKVAMYNTGERIDVFYDNKEGKTVTLNADTMMTVSLYNYLETDNTWQTILGSTLASVRKVEYDGKDCYLIKNFMSPMFLNGENTNEVYIEKDTGLYLKSVVDDITSEREYEFNNVDDSIFVEPDISQYTINENN